MTETTMWTLIGLQATIQISLIVGMTQISGLLKEAIGLMRSVKQKLDDDATDHAIIVEKLKTLDGDVRELRRDYHER